MFMESPRARRDTGQHRSSAGEFVTFLLVGGGAALGYVAISSGIIALRTDVPDWIVASSCYAAMIVPVYLAHRRLSFRSGTAHGVALPRYVGVQAIGMTVASAISYVAFDVLSLPSLLASVLIIVLVSTANYLLLRLWAFRAKE